jgi:ribosome-binding ATPase YchF (GTP1/OBG family)
MKNIGIMGMPYSGKTTLFVALTHSDAPGGRLHQAVVEVRDERLAVLATVEGSRKVVPARVCFVDVPAGLSAHGIGEFRPMDALCLVVRAFGDGADPVKELAALEAELVLADLTSIESGLEKARKRARSHPEARAEAEVLEAARSLLERERPLREGAFDALAEKVLRGYGPLTMKPWVVVANVEEGASGVPEGLPGETVTINAELEAEVVGLEESEARELLAGYGIEEPARDRVIAACYGALDLITFFTTANQEAHAWQVHRGAKAFEAAGVIHSDMERGFIRAEVVSYDELVEAGSWEEARARGYMRIEGRDHLVNEGDVLHIRFAV